MGKHKKRKANNEGERTERTDFASKIEEGRKRNSGKNLMPVCKCKVEQEKTIWKGNEEVKKRKYCVSGKTGEEDGRCARMRH
jgi:hypothetical protein